MAGGLEAVADGLTFDLPPDGRAVIGRATNCDVWFDDLRVSRVHAEVWATPAGWVLADRGSRLGTWRDGERVEEVRIDGRTELRLANGVDGPLLVLTPKAPTAGGATVSFRAPVRATGSYQAAHDVSGVRRIGRADDNDIVLDDLLVSRHHAELRTLPSGQVEITDLDSLNGTYVNGAPVGHAVLAELDLIGVGHSEFRLIEGRLQEYVDAGAVTFAAERVSVTGRGGVTLVDEVSFSLAEKSLLAVVGPSGAGKSTLLGALSGLRPPATGHVLYGGRDLIGDYAQLRHRIGFVPQEDVLHRELEVGRALEYAGRLRFPADVSAGDRSSRIEEVLGELGIAHRVSSPIHRLSGGERKRTNVALELLTKPSLLFLDEPVSGLDPGLARVLMGLLRDLADEGRTVVVVTHEISSLSLCDQILVLAPGGVPAYVGPPDGVVGRFGESDMADVFTELSTTDPQSWHIGRQVPAALPGLEAGAEAEPDADEPQAPPAPTSGQGWFSQLRTLTERYIEVLASDRRNAALLLLQAPILGILILAALPAGELGPPGASEVRLVSAAGIVLFVLLVGATWLGANNAIREIARELPMIRRERAAGLSLSAYVVSKAVVLGALTVVQAVVLVALATLRQNGPGDAVLLGWGLGELMLVVALAGVASMALALFISAVAGSPERATSVLPVVLILQLVLAAGVVLPEIVDKPVLNQLSLVSSTQWGIAGAAATADLNELQVFDDRLRDLRTVDASDPNRAVEALGASPDPPQRWAHTVGSLLTSLAALLALTVVPLVATTRVLRRYDPGRT